MDNHIIIFDTSSSLAVGHGSSQGCNSAAAFSVFPKTSYANGLNLNVWDLTISAAECLQQKKQTDFPQLVTRSTAQSMDQIWFEVNGLALFCTYVHLRTIGTSCRTMYGQNTAINVHERLMISQYLRLFRAETSINRLLDIWHISQLYHIHFTWIWGYGIHIHVCVNRLKTRQTALVYVECITDLTLKSKESR